MKTAYQILEVSQTADDKQIKQAYLHKIKQFPPEQKLQFQRIHQAYTEIKDHQSRLSYKLFKQNKADFNALLNQAINMPKQLSMTAEQFNTLLSVCSDDDSLFNLLAMQNQHE